MAADSLMKVVEEVEEHHLQELVSAMHSREVNVNVVILVALITKVVMVVGTQDIKLPLASLLLLEI